MSSADAIMIAVTALGDLAGRDPVTRAGARPGDQVAVAGIPGRSAAGLALLMAGQAEPAALIAAHRRPRPPYDAGPQAAVLGAASMIDISHGLVQDLGHVAAASGVRIDIDTARLRRSIRNSRRRRRHWPASDWLGWALTGGEDHALAATFPAGIRAAPALVGYRHCQRRPGGTRRWRQPARVRGMGSISAEQATITAGI